MSHFVTVLTTVWDMRLILSVSVKLQLQQSVDKSAAMKTIRYVRCCFNACSKVSLIYCAEPTTTHTHPFNGLFPGLPGWASTRVAKPISYKPDALPAAQPTASRDWRHEHWRNQQLKSGRTEKLKKYKQICLELSANSPGNPWSQSWKDTSVCLSAQWCVAWKSPLWKAVNGTGLLFWRSANSRLGLCKKVKVAHTRLPSIGFCSWSRFLAVSL